MTEQSAQSRHSMAALLHNQQQDSKWIAVKKYNKNQEFETEAL